MLFFLLFLLLLPFPSQAAEYPQCPSTSACLLFLHCNDVSDSEGTLHDVTSESAQIDCNETSHVWMAIQPLTATRWAIEIASSHSTLAGITISFGKNDINFIDETSMKVNVQTEKGWTKVIPITSHPNDTSRNMHAKFRLEDPKMIWLDHFDQSEISIKSDIHNSKIPKFLDSFWNTIREKTPKCAKPIDDACSEAGGVKCEKLIPTNWSVPCNDKLWMNEGSEEEEKWRLLAGIECENGEWKGVGDNYGSPTEVEKRPLLCSANKPGNKKCLRQEVKNVCDEGCDLFNITRTRVTCNAKFWINSESTFSNNWQLVKQMVCTNGTWEWRAESGDDKYQPFNKQKLACLLDTPQQYKAAFYAAVIGGPAVFAVIFVIIIIVCCCLRRKGKKKKTKRRRSRTSDTQTEVTKTDMDTTVCSLGVKIKKQKKQTDIWSWSREQKKASESSSNVSSSVNNQESSGDDDKGKMKNSKKKNGKKIPSIRENQYLL